MAGDDTPVRSEEDGARGGAWTGGWFRHRWGWLSLGEALQIWWSPAKTEVARDDGRRRTVADGETVADSDDFVNSDSG